MYACENLYFTVYAWLRVSKIILSVCLYARMYVYML